MGLLVDEGLVDAGSVFKMWGFTIQRTSSVLENLLTQRRAIGDEHFVRHFSKLAARAAEYDKANDAGGGRSQ